MKNRLKFALLLTLLVGWGRASALNVFECTRGLMRVTERALLQAERKGFEAPFFAGEYLVFPEVNNGKLVGFFVYKDKRAWHYDSVERLAKTKVQPSIRLESAPLSRDRIYQLIAQPDGLRTMTLQYLPGIGATEASAKAPVALGATVLPVVGAWIGRTRPVTRSVYYDPAKIPESKIRSWLYQHLDRKPSSPEEIEIKRPLIRLTSSSKLQNNALWQPLESELQLRKNWIRSNNLDADSFQLFSQLLQGPCRE